MPRRSKALARRAGLRHDAKLRSRRWRKRKTDVALAAEFRYAIMLRDALCIGALYSKRPCEFPMGVDMDPMHLIPAQLLRRHGFSEEIVYDPRNGVAGCRVHHRLNDSGKERIPAEWIPLRAVAFARAHGIEHVLEKLYGPF